MDSPHPNPATLTGQSVATWTFKCLQPGSHNLTYSYSATSGSGTYLATKAAFEIPTTLSGATVVCIPTTASVNGYIKLQGRLGTEPSPKGWYNSIVTLTCVSGSCSSPLHAPYVLRPPTTRASTSW